MDRQPNNLMTGLTDFLADVFDLKQAKRLADGLTIKKQKHKYMNKHIQTESDYIRARTYSVADREKEKEQTERL